MNNILEQVKYFEAQGIYCVPVESGGKKPLTKNGLWKDVEWLDSDFLKADAFGIQHEKSNIVDVDFDFLLSTRFQHLLPDTLTIGKKVNGVTIAECFGPLNELAFPMRVAVRAHPGETSVTQAPVGSTYPVGTIIPVNVIGDVKSKK